MIIILVWVKKFLTHFDRWTKPDKITRLIFNDVVVVQCFLSLEASLSVSPSNCASLDFKIVTVLYL